MRFPRWFEKSRFYYTRSVSWQLTEPLIRTINQLLEHFLIVSLTEIWSVKRFFFFQRIRIYYNQETFQFCELAHGGQASYSVTRDRSSLGKTAKWKRIFLRHSNLRTIPPVQSKSTRFYTMVAKLIWNL